MSVPPTFGRNEHSILIIPFLPSKLPTGKWMEYSLKSLWIVPFHSSPHGPSPSPKWKLVWLFDKENPIRQTFMCLRQLIKSKNIVLVKLEFHKFVGELYTVIPSFRVIRFKKNDLENLFRSEERRVGKECVCWCRSRWSPYH